MQSSHLVTDEPSFPIGSPTRVGLDATTPRIAEESTLLALNNFTYRHVVDFYISDFQSGLRALVKTGFGARVTPYVDDSVVIDVNPENKDMSPDFLRWLGQRNLSSDDRVMQLKEGYIKEGSTVSVMGVVHRNDNVLMIVPPPEPLTTGCQWAKCIFPASLEGIVLRCEDTSKIDVIPV
ncbi:ubiquitin-specific protease family C19 protein [Trifolium pratense]|uniref:Ubiquitin-specific protease family C19 protein n=1 Tax=Trifolium pratense TaxID=57577 RepID=A0A2K3PHG0_TRIPR|nr:ubiquitin-specific protease family C19 protein [Trifolium pratense]